jgi:magnesium chelatase family protein
MNPCPCGYLGDTSGQCRCTPDQINRYRTRLSGPLLDRLDMHIEVARLPDGILIAKNNHARETSAVVQERVVQARQIQIERAKKINADLQNNEINKFCSLTDKDNELLEHAIKRFNLSARAVHRILKVARTIADLAGKNDVTTEHLSEALGFRGIT